MSASLPTRRISAASQLTSIGANRFERKTKSGVKSSASNVSGGFVKEVGIDERMLRHVAPAAGL